MATTPSKYIRYILFAILGIAILHFISSASLPHFNASDLTHGVNTQNEKPKDDSPKDDNPTDRKVEANIPPFVNTPVEGKPLATAIPKPDAEPEQKQDTQPQPTSEASPPSTELTKNPPTDLVNATFVSLVRNSDLWEIAKSIRQVEDRFNRNYHYDWVFLNDGEFTEEFKKTTSALVSGTTHYGLIPTDHWSFPDFIDQDKAAKVREEMKEKKIIYGDSISYRHMCRYESGFFFRHELMMQYDYYWRVEPSVQYFCDIAFDPFKFMKENNKKYSFVISLHEYRETVATLWDSVKKFMKQYPQHIVEDNNMDFVTEDGGETYNLCHFWSNFEIGDLNWLRSPQYINYFEVLDQDGGFFYERWGDAPVHSIAAALMLKKDEVHFFNDIAYYHVPFTHCPTGEDVRLDLKCHCNPKDNFDWKGYSCTSRYFETNKLEKPAGYEEQTG